MEAAAMDASVRVTILEDQALMRQSLSDVLQDAGFEVVGQYADPGLFLSRVGVDLPQVAIVDLNLPGPDGFSLLQDLFACDDRVRVLVFSMHAHTGYAVRALRLGARG